MTEEQFELLYERGKEIWVAVHDLVDKMTDDLDEEMDDLIRQKLTEEFRLWRRIT